MIPFNLFRIHIHNLHRAQRVVHASWAIMDLVVAEFSTMQVQLNLGEDISNFLPKVGMEPQLIQVHLGVPVLEEIL
jgi:hypothetical protein